jgi:hypothetical protein
MIRNDGASSDSPRFYRRVRIQANIVRIPVKWATDSGEVGQSRSEATLVVFLH